MKPFLSLAFTILALPLLARAGQLELPLNELGRSYSQSPLWISHSQSARVVVGAESPFGADEKERALRVQNDLNSESQFRFRARLWEGAEPAPLKGAVEVPLKLVGGAVQVHVGSSLEPLTPQASSVQVSQDRVHCRVTLEVGKPPMVLYGGKQEKGGAELPVEKGAALLRMEWDYTPGQTPFFALSLNGEPIGGTELRREPTPQMLEQGGANTLTILSIQSEEPSEYFIGPITFTES